MSREEVLLEKQTKTILDLQDKIRALQFDNAKCKKRIQSLEIAIKNNRESIKRIAEQVEEIILKKNYEDLNKVVEVLNRMGVERDKK